MPKPVINIDDLEYTEFGKGDKFTARRAPVSTHIGAQRLGYAVVRVPPGKRAWPYHAHHVIEEMFYILSGEGTLRHAGEEYPLRPGDFVCAPPDPEQPHQIVNTSDGELAYIALSDMPNTDIVLYPDSGKYGAWHGDPKNPRAPGEFRVLARQETAVDYWDGETDDEG